MNKVLIVGYGSIGKRHADCFARAGAEVAILTQQRLAGVNTFGDLSTALDSFKPNVVVIANSTEKHVPTLQELVKLSFDGTVLVEKPLHDKVLNLSHSFAGLFIAYNLRMSPLLERLKTELQSRKIISANIYCGQYLPDWRPGRDYRTVYSAFKSQGGGVLRDLSHELDYTQWLLGSFDSLAALGGHFSELEIETDDVFSLLGTTVRCPHVSLSVNYLDKVAKRTILIHCSDVSFYVDMVAGRLMKNGEILIDSSKVSETYLVQAQRILEGDWQNLCHLDDANATASVIEAAEAASSNRKFIQI